MDSECSVISDKSRIISHSTVWLDINSVKSLRVMLLAFEQIYQRSVSSYTRVIQLGGKTT